jgi:hypothetical protein
MVFRGERRFFSHPFKSQLMQCMTTLWWNGRVGYHFGTAIHSLVSTNRCNNADTTLVLIFSIEKSFFHHVVLEKIVFPTVLKVGVNDVQTITLGVVLDVE